MLLQRAVKNSGFSIAAQIVTLILGLLFAGMTIRYLGPAQAGFFLVASSILGWNQMAGAGSFKAPAVQKLAQYFTNQSFHQSRILSSTIISANLVIAIPFVIATIFAFPILFSWSKLDTTYENSAYLVVLLGSIGFFIDQWASSIRGVYEAHQRFDIAAYTSSFFGLFGNLARLFSLIYFSNMSSLAITNLIISAAWLLTDFYFVRKLLGGGFMPGWNWKELKPLLNFGFWSWIGNTSNVIYFNITGLILTKHLGSAYLPYIALPQNIVGKVHQFFLSTSYFLFPTLAAQGEQVHEDIARLDDRLRWFMAVMSFYVYTAIYLLGPFLLKILVNKDFSDQANIALGFYCLWGIFTSQMIVNVFTTMSVGKAQANAVVDIIVSCLTIVLTFIFIPKWGFVGVCVAQMVKLPAVIWHLLWSRKLLRLPLRIKETFSPYFSPAIASLAWVGISTIFLSNNNPTFVQYLLVFSIGSALFALLIFCLEKLSFNKFSRINSLIVVYKYIKSIYHNSKFVQRALSLTHL